MSDAQNVDGSLNPDDARAVRDELELSDDAPIGDDECRRYMARRHGLPDDAPWEQIDPVAEKEDRPFDDWFRDVTRFTKK